MKKFLTAICSALLLMAVCATPVLACTSYYVGSELTADGSTMYGRTEDIGAAYDKVFQVIPAAEVGENATYVDPTGATSFQAPLYVEKTYRYNVTRDSIAADDGYFGEIGQNEMGVTMSATTSASASRSITGFDPYVRGTGITEENLVDYILCQASSARNGVEILAKVIDEIGAGEGNGLFIADQNEVWYFEMLTGHNYCAIRMPEDKVALIPNCLVIGDVDLSDTENVIASANLVNLAKENEFFVEAQTAGDINVKLTYAGKGYSANNGDRIRGGQYLLSKGAINNEAIYTDEYQDIFFTVEDKIDVEMLYELAGYRYDDMIENGAWGEDRKVTRVIGTPSSCECHIVQTRHDMPTELASVVWLSMGSADLSVFVPFYSALLTDVAPAYKEEAYDYSATSAYWIFRSLSSLAATNRENYAPAVKGFYKNYMLKLQDAKATVDQQLLDVYNNDRENLEYYATNLGIAIGEETMGFASKMEGELIKYRSKYENYNFVNNRGGLFSTSLTADDIVYDLSMVAAPAQPEPEPEPEPVKPVVKAPGKVTIEKVTNVKSKKVIIDIKKVSKAYAYEYQCSTSLNFSKKATLIKNSKKLSKSFSGLKKGSTYYVRVRAYKKDGSEKVYGKWSYIKKVTIKK